MNPGQTNYAASKGAINCFTRALAVELASRGVTVNAIAPGFIETDMSAAVRNKAGDLIKKFIPMKRIGTPEDIARVAVFLASADSAYITGQVLTVDGGLSLGAVGASVTLVTVTVAGRGLAETDVRSPLILFCERTAAMPTQDEIYTKVSATLVEALNVDEDDIKPTSTLQGDLGAESIDFLDIVFRLEREFGIKIPRGELFPESIFQGDPDFVQNGKVTDKGLDELRDADAVRRPRRVREEPGGQPPQRPVHGRSDHALHPGQAGEPELTATEAARSRTPTGEPAACARTSQRLAGGDHALDLDRPLRGVSAAASRRGR